MFFVTLSGGTFTKERNTTNPLGYKGKLVDTFASLLKKLWTGQHEKLSPHSILVCVYQHTHTHTHTHTDIHTHKHTRMHTHAYTCKHTYACTQTHTYICMYLHTHVHNFIYPCYILMRCVYRGISCLFNMCAESNGFQVQPVY